MCGAAGGCNSPPSTRRSTALLGRQALLRWPFDALLSQCPHRRLQFLGNVGDRPLMQPRELDRAATELVVH